MRVPANHSRSDYDFFFFNDTATTEIYTLSLHDALPICQGVRRISSRSLKVPGSLSSALQTIYLTASAVRRTVSHLRKVGKRSEEHTSELQSLTHIVCRLLRVKKQITGARRCDIDESGSH